MVLNIFTLILLLTLSGCSSIQSGKYVQIKKGENLAVIAKKHNVPIWKIQEANQGKRASTGDWIFVPQKRGIVPNLYEQSFEVKGQEFLATGKFLWPVPSNKSISSKYGHRWGRPHEGIDIPAREGASFLACADAVVVYSGNDLSGYGNLVVLGHKDGIFSVYAHAQKIFVEKGAKVFKGQVIGKVGQTGRASGPHLHFEMRKLSRAVNPVDFLVFN